MGDNVFSAEIAIWGMYGIPHFLTNQCVLLFLHIFAVRYGPPNSSISGTSGITAV